MCMQSKLEFPLIIICSRFLWRTLFPSRMPVLTLILLQEPAALLNPEEGCCWSKTDWSWCLHTYKCLVFSSLASLDFWLPLGFQPGLYPSLASSFPLGSLQVLQPASGLTFYAVWQHSVLLSAILIFLNCNETILYDFFSVSFFW